MAKKKVESYEERNYEQKQCIYDSLAQCIQDLKYGEVVTANKWNALAEKIKGFTSRLVGNEHVELTYHHIEVTTVEGLARMEDDGKDFIKEAVKELKKIFKKKTGKALNMKEIKYDRSLEKMSQLQGERNWLLGGGPYGARPVGRYLVRDSVVYSFNCDVLE
jgi:hypothetical protein